MEQAELLREKGPIFTEICADGVEGAGFTLQVYTIVIGAGLVKVAVLHSLFKVTMIVPHKNLDVLNTTALTFIVYTKLAADPIAPLPVYTEM